MESKKFSIEEALKTGWQKTKENFLFLFCTGLVTFIVSAVLNSASDGDSPVAILSSLVSIMFGVFINVGLVKIILKMLDGGKPIVHTFFEITPSQFFRYFGYSIVYGICIVVGLILLIVPGIIAIIRLQPGYYLVVDKGMGPIEALKASWNMTKGETWNLFLFTLVVVAMNIVGAIIFFIGLIVTIPITMVAMGYIYRKLSGTMLPQTAAVEAHPVVQAPAETPAENKTSDQTPPQQ
jgi:uncharacterized membrane protein